MLLRRLLEKNLELKKNCFKLNNFIFKNKSQFRKLRHQNTTSKIEKFDNLTKNQFGKLQFQNTII